VADISQRSINVTKHDETKGWSNDNATIKLNARHHLLDVVRMRGLHTCYKAEYVQVLTITDSEMDGYFVFYFFLYFVFFHVMIHVDIVYE